MLRIRVDIRRIRIQLMEKTDPDPDEILLGNWIFILTHCLNCKIYVVPLFVIVNPVVYKL